MGSCRSWILAFHFVIGSCRSKILIFGRGTSASSVWLWWLRLQCCHWRALNWSKGPMLVWEGPLHTLEGSVWLKKALCSTEREMCWPGKAVCWPYQALTWPWRSSSCLTFSLPKRVLHMTESLLVSHHVRSFDLTSGQIFKLTFPGQNAYVSGCLNAVWPIPENWVGKQA